MTSLVRFHFRFRPSPSASARGFSLIEMLAVMTIMSLVAGFTLPALKGITGGNSVSAGAAQLSDLLSLARSQAIAQHTIVRFVVATEWNGSEAQANLRRASLWAWQPLSLTNTASTSSDSPTPTGFWKPITTWQELPEGVVLEPGLPQYVLNSSYASEDASTVRGSCVLGNDTHDFADNASFSAPTTSGVISTRFIEFLPTGAANIPGSSDRQAIFVAAQGYTGAGSQITYTAQSHGQPTNWAQVNVDTLTGHVHVYRP
jgi:prepilin-type N-terminal cleavage/methylation domain-containing protein